MTTTQIAMKPGLAAAEELMNRVLRDGAPIADEYPLVFREGFPGQIVALGDGEGVRSACTVLLRDLVSPQGELRAGFIGSVATDPAFRRQGLASQVLEGAEMRLANQGAIVSMLWAEDPRFYYARGYRPVGAEDDYQISPEVAGNLPETDAVREGGEEDTEAIHQLYLTHTARTNRRLEETAALLECPGMSTRVVERDGEVVAYALMGRGGDLERTIHEWAGEIDDVLALVRAHVATATNDEPTFVMAPTQFTELRERMRAAGARTGRGILALAKIVDRGRAAQKLGKILGPNATITFDPTAIEANQVHLRTPLGEAHLNDDTLLVLLFSTGGERADTLAFGDHFGVDVSNLPFEPFVWGLDSI